MSRLDWSKRYRVDGWPAVAVWIAGEETEASEETHWDGIEEPTGRLLVVMVGDDYRHAVDPEELSVIEELDYCAECGQLGCTHDGRER